MHLPLSATGCDDGNPCTADTCNATTGACVHTTAATPSACGPAPVCVQATCTCVLGHFGLPALGKEWLRSAVATPGGFTAVGEGVSPQGQRGLLIAVDLANQVVLVRRIGGMPAVDFAAVAVDAVGIRVAATTGGSQVGLVTLDALGNLTGQSVLFNGGEAQSLVPVADGSVVVLGTESWAAGSRARLFRVGGSGVVAWSQTLATPSPAHAARAYALAFVQGHLLVGGQHHVFGAP